MKADTVDAVILCGGRGSRMGGQDKGLIELDGRPLYQHVLDSLPQHGLGRIFLSANRHQAQYALSGLSVLADARPDYPGPLAGIEAALLASEAEWLLVLPCDMPGLPLDLFDRLWAARTQAPLLRVRDEERTQPLLCLLQRSLLGSLQQALAAGRNAVMPWQDAAGVREVLFTGLLANCNTPSALQAQGAATPPTSTAA